VPEQIHLGNGKIKRVYRRWATPHQLLQAVPDCEAYLRSGVRAAELQARAAAQSDTEAALAMQEAKRELFRHIGRKTDNFAQQLWKCRAVESVENQNRFPTLPTALGNRSAIPTFPQLRRPDIALSNPKTERSPADTQLLFFRLIFR